MLTTPEVRRLFRKVLRARRFLLVSLVSAMVLSIVVVYASNTDGYATTKVALTDASVWVTNDAEGLVGRVNRQIDELNSAVKTNRPFDVLQENDSVLVVDSLAHQLRPVDTGTVTLGTKIGLPVAPSVGLGGGVIGIADTTTGKVWAGTADSLAGLDPTSAAPLLITAPHAALTVSASGSIYVAAAGSDKLWTLALDGQGKPLGAIAPGRTVSPATLPGGALSAAVLGQSAPISITVVGQVPVVLDRKAGVVIAGDRRIAVPGAATAVLQQPGPAADSVLVSTASALLRVPLQGGPVQTLSDKGSGSPAAPVLLDGCLHAAWGGSASVYLHVCGSDVPTVVAIPSTNGRASLAFRVNRHVIVLNDHATGEIWLVDQQMKIVDNWDKVQPEVQPDDATGNQGNTSGSTELTSSRTDAGPRRRGIRRRQRIRSVCGPGGRPCCGSWTTMRPPTVPW